MGLYPQEHTTLRSAAAAASRCLSHTKTGSIIYHYTHTIVINICALMSLDYSFNIISLWNIQLSYTYLLFLRRIRCVHVFLIADFHRQLPIPNIAPPYDFPIDFPIISSSCPMTIACVSVGLDDGVPPVDVLLYR